MLIHLIKTISLCSLKIIYVSAVHPKNIQPLPVIEPAPNWEHLADWVCYSEDTEKPNYYRCNYKLLSRQQKRCFRDLKKAGQVALSMKHKPSHYYAPVLLNTQTAPQLLFLTRQSQVEQVNALHAWMTQPRQRGSGALKPRRGNHPGSRRWMQRHATFETKVRVVTSGD